MKYLISSSQILMNIINNIELEKYDEQQQLVTDRPTVYL